MVRAVIDTNVLVSAITHNGKPRRLVLRLLETHTVILSSQMLAELADVLSREKFSVSSSQVDRFLTSLVNACKIMPDNPRFKVVFEDPDDDVVINVAYSGKADYIVTGDKHLLDLSQFKKTRIVTVNEMLETLV
jgi:putative PIN family toxin of toxin-antitoxin system